MARMLRNLGEYVSGRIGNVVFVRTKTKSYVRKAPNCEKTVWSDQQLLYRNRIKKVAAFWRSLKSEKISGIWNKAGSQNSGNPMNGFAWFVKLNIPAFNIDGSLIDPLLLSVSDGKLICPQKLTVQALDFNPAYAEVSWQNDSNMKPDRGDDELFVVGYSDGNFSDPYNTQITRVESNGTFLIPLINATINPSHLFLFFGSLDQEYSKSNCFDLVE